MWSGEETGRAGVEAVGLAGSELGNLAGSELGTTKVPLVLTEGIMGTVGRLLDTGGRLFDTAGGLLDTTDGLLGVVEVSPPFWECIGEDVINLL